MPAAVRGLSRYGRLLRVLFLWDGSMPANATRPSLLLELTSQFWVRQRRFKRKPRTCASRTISDILPRPRFALAVVAIVVQTL